MDKKGFLIAISTFSFWGVVPLYWREVYHISSLELLYHRIIWGVLSLGAFIYLSNESGLRFKSLLLPKLDLGLIARTLLIGANWFIFIYGVSHGHLVDVSLGYFLNPLINVLFGRIFFKEQMSWPKYLAVFAAFMGVFLMGLQEAQALWISLGLAISFAFYGVIKKKTKVSSINGLYHELLLLLPLTLLLIGESIASSSFQFLDQDGFGMFLIFLAGPVTILPMLGFGSAVKRLSLGSMGMLQYIAPCLQFILGLVVFKEVFSQMKLFAFSLIWLGILIYLKNEWGQSWKKNENRV